MKILTICLAFAVASGQDFYTNPVIDANHPDPGVLKLPNGSGFVAVTTSNYASDPIPAFPILFSADLVHWEQKGHVFPSGSWPQWSIGDMWAPEIHYVNENYVVYFSARSGLDFTLAIGIAISKDPKNPYGPYEDIGYPIVEGFLGVIDIHWFRDPKSGFPYLLWKTDDNALGMESRMYIQRVEEDGFTLAEDSEPVLIMKAESNDSLVVEGGSIIYKDGLYYLFFSSNGYDNPNYHVNVARSANLEEYFSERFDNFLHTDFDRFDQGINCTFVGPGHGTPLELESGEFWYVYHTWKYELVNVDPPGRVLNLDRIHWRDDGWPEIGVPSDTAQIVPKIS